MSSSYLVGVPDDEWRWPLQHKHSIGLDDWMIQDWEWRFTVTLPKLEISNSNSRCEILFNTPYKGWNPKILLIHWKFWKRLLTYAQQRPCWSTRWLMKMAPTTEALNGIGLLEDSRSRTGISCNSDPRGLYKPCYTSRCHGCDSHGHLHVNTIYNKPIC